MQIQPFAVEEWMNEFETRCDYNLAETCVESLSIEQLLDLAEQPADQLRDELLAMHRCCNHRIVPPCLMRCGPLRAIN